MALLFDVEFSQKKFKKMKEMFSQEFPTASSKDSNENQANKHAQKVFKLIETDAALTDQNKFYFMILLLKSMSDKGKKNCFLLFEPESIHSKAQGILKKVLLNKTSLDNTIHLLTKHSLDRYQKSSFRMITNISVNFNPEDHLIDTCLHTAISSCMQELSKFSEFNQYLDKLGLTEAVVKYGKMDQLKPK